MAAQFRCVDAAVIRVAAFGSELDLPPWPDLTGDTPVHVREWRSWLRRVWEQDALSEAIEIASPVLARRMGDVCGGQVQQPRRVVESVVRYLLRTTSRATPFGFFAGVAPRPQLCQLRPLGEQPVGHRAAREPPLPQQLGDPEQVLVQRRSTATTVRDRRAPRTRRVAPGPTHTPPHPIGWAGT